MRLTEIAKATDFTRKEIANVSQRFDFRPDVSSRNIQTYDDFEKILLLTCTKLLRSLKANDVRKFIRDMRDGRQEFIYFQEFEWATSAGLEVLVKPEKLKSK